MNGPPGARSRARARSSTAGWSRSPISSPRSRSDSPWSTRQAPRSAPPGCSRSRSCDERPRGRRQCPAGLHVPRGTGAHRQLQARRAAGDPAVGGRRHGRRSRRLRGERLAQARARPGLGPVLAVRRPRRGGAAQGRVRRVSAATEQGGLRRGRRHPRLRYRHRLRVPREPVLRAGDPRSDALDLGRAGVRHGDHARWRHVHRGDGLQGAPEPLRRFQTLPGPARTLRGRRPALALQPVRAASGPGHGADRPGLSRPQHRRVPAERTRDESLAGNRVRHGPGAAAGGAHGPGFGHPGRAVHRHGQDPLPRRGDRRHDVLPQVARRARHPRQGGPDDARGRVRRRAGSDGEGQVPGARVPGKEYREDGAASVASVRPHQHAGSLATDRARGGARMTTPPSPGDAERLAREMEVARSIQRDFLPESLPIAMGVQLEAALEPAREVSGDFYDAFLLPPSGTIVLVVGDVCDKGVGAALFMALFRSLIRASADPVGGGAIQMIGGRRTLVRQALESATPADLLTRVASFTNDYIARLHGRTNMFATVFLGALDPGSGQLDYVNAGHEPALLVGPGGGMRELRPTGPALGLLPDRTFTAGAATLEPGDGLFAFTDGLVEARSPAGEVFGAERLRDALRANTTSATTLVRGVLDALHAFTGQAEPHDDVTLLAASRTVG